MRSCFDKTLVWIAIYQLCVCTLFFILSHNSKLVHALHSSSLQSDKNLGSRECRHLVMGHLYTACNHYQQRGHYHEMKVKMEMESC